MSASVQGASTGGCELHPPVSLLTRCAHSQSLLTQPSRPLITASSSGNQLPPCSSLLAALGRQTAAAFSVAQSHGTAAPTPPLGGSEGGAAGETDEFAANYAEAVEVLRDNLPCTFSRDPCLHIFRDDLTFRTPMLRYSSGLWQYLLLHRAARLLGNLLYADLRLDLTRMWQPAGSRRQLRVSCCLSGRPRLSLSRARQSTEVISTYCFDARGSIHEHQLDQIIPPESMMVRFLEWLVGRLQPGMTCSA